MSGVSLKRTLLGGLAVLAATILARGVTMQLISALGGTRDGLLLGAGILAGSLCGAAVLFFVSKQPRTDLALNPVAPARVAAWTFAALAVGAAFDVAAWATGRPIVEPSWGDVYRAGPVWLLAVALAATSVFEELFFRGWLFGGLSASKVRPMGAATLVTLLFAAVHFPSDAWRFAEVLVGGGMLALIRIRTGSSWPGMVPHVFGNLKVLVLLAVL